MVHTKPPIVSVINLGRKVPETEKTTKTSRWHQVLSCLPLQMIGLLHGFCMAQSSSLVPQLEAPDSEVPMTRDDTAWITNAMNLAVLAGSLLGGALTERLGRVNAMRLLCVPLTAGWFVVATADSFAQLFTGRFLMGASLGAGQVIVVLYITEVAEKEIRGLLSCLGPLLVSAGLMLGYLLGAYLSWRTVSWVCGCMPAVMLVMTLFTVESPVWLREHHREDAGKRASLHFYRDPDKVLSTPKGSDGNEKPSFLQDLRVLATTPTGIKPMILLNGLFILQQVAGVYVTIFYAVTFFQEAGTEMDPYICTVFIGLTRFVFTGVTFALSRVVGRRPLMVWTSVGMGLCMLGSGLGTRAILASPEDAPAWLSWMVVAFVLMYVGLSCLGIQVLPWAMMGEVFPQQVRAVAQSINMGVSYIYVFIMLQLYPALSGWLGGAAGAQFLFSGASFCVAAFSWLLLVETRGRSLQDIEEFFQHHIIYPGHQKKRQGTNPT